MLTLYLTAIERAFLSDSLEFGFVFPGNLHPSPALNEVVYCVPTCRYDVFGREKVLRIDVQCKEVRLIGTPLNGCFHSSVVGASYDERGLEGGAGVHCQDRPL